MWSARGTTVPMITASTSRLRKAFELEQLVKPDRILVGGPPRVGRDPPARLDLAAVDQREDEVGIAGIDGEQHGARPSRRRLRVHNSTSPARTISSAPSSRRRRSAPSGSSPSKRPLTRLVAARMDRERACRSDARGRARPARATPVRSAATARAAARSSPRAAARRPAARSRPPSDAHWPVRQAAGATARLTPKPTTTRSPLRSSRMPASFLPSSSTSLGHLSISGWPGTATSTASISARPAASDSVCARRIAGAQLDQRAAVEIARRAKAQSGPAGPCPPPARARPASRLRPRCRIGNQVGIGRAGALDDADAGQKSDPAARSVSAPSGPISR